MSSSKINLMAAKKIFKSSSTMDPKQEFGCFQISTSYSRIIYIRIINVSRCTGGDVRIAFP